MLNELELCFLWVAKIFMWLGSGLLFACVVCGLWFMWNLFTVTLYTMSVAAKWYMYNRLSPEAKKELLKKSKHYDKATFSDEEKYDNK
jgi:hypothetical protein